MSVAGLCVVLAGTLLLFGVILNHVYARLALVELTLNEGLPPGHEVIADGLAHGQRSLAIASADLLALLAPGVHIFASRNCHACQRLLDELDATTLDIAGDLHLHYIDRPRPLATGVAQRHGATLHAHQEELAVRSGADPLPYTIAIGAQSLISRAVSPSIAQVLETARNAGIRAQEQAST